MNQAFNPVFAFKRLMGDENANNVILRLMCHPVLWETISNENKFLQLKDLFGSDIEKWTPKNICINAAEIREPNNLSENKEINWDGLEKEDQLVDILESVTQIEAQKQNNKTWGEIFNELHLSEIEEDQLIKKWGMVFEIIANDEPERKELENALVENDSSKLSLLSFLIHCSIGQDHIDDFLKRNINIFISYPEILKELIFKLDNFGEHKKAKLLGRKFLDHPDVLRMEIGCDKSTLLQIDKLEELRKLTELRILSSFMHDEEKCQFYKDITEKLFIQSTNINPVRLYVQETEIDDKDLFSLENFISIKKKHNDKANSLVTQNLKDIFDAFNLMNSNESGAREICKRFVNHIHEEGIENVIYSPEIGYLIDPIDIAKILIKLGLKDDAVLLLEGILNSHSGNKQITKFMAHYSRMFGDHKRAVKYYSILFAKDKILRGEKIQFFRSLQYLGMWQDAFIVHKTINKLNTNDKLEYAISAFRAEKTTEFQNEIGEILSNSPNNKTAQSLKALFHQRNNEKLLSSTLIENVINASNKDIRTIKFIEEYLGKSDDVEKQGKFLEDLPFKYQNHPEIALLNAKVKRSLGKTRDYIKILRDLSSAKGEIKQVVVEEILSELIDNNMFEGAATFLQTYGENWVLSPKIGQAKLKVFIEAREFIKAEIVLSSLLSREIINQEIIVDYGCLLLKTSLAEFPYSRTSNMLSNQEVNKFQDLLGSLNIKNPSLLLRMMQIEIGNGEKEAGYFDLVPDRAFNNSLESWRIPYGLGNLHFRKNNFDQAIIYLKKAQKLEPTHPVILDLMIQAYCRLKLPDEAIGLIKLQITRNNLTLRKILKYTDFLYENNKFDSLLDSQEEGNKYDFMFSIAKAKSLINKNQFKDAENCLVEIEKKKHISPGDLPVIAQYYLYCESPKSAIRVMEKYLSQKEDLSQSNIIESASIYYQLNDYEKALHLINISNKRNANISFIKADILVQLKENDLAGEAFNEAIRLIEETEIPVIKFDGFEIFIPENWKRDLPGQYFSATLLKAKDGQITDAFNLAKKSAAQFPVNQSLWELTLKLAHILGDKKYVEEYIEKKPENYNNNEEEIVIKAENALENNEEVKAAGIIADFNNEYKGNNHLAVIQARLLNRNGNRQEAESVYLTLLNQMQSENFPHEISSINEIDRLISYLAVSETAYELDDLTTAIDLSRNLIYIFGLTNRLAQLFLKILTRMLERNRLFKKLLVKNHNHRIIEDDIDIFEEIVKSEKLDHLDLKEWIDRSQAVLYEENTYHEEVIKLSPTEQNVGAIIFSLISLGRKTEVDSVLALMNDNQETLFTYAVLLIDDEPEKAKSIVLDVLKKGDPKPEHYLTLSFVNEHFGQLADSYSAICLALNKWPEEYEWENMAGNLCKIMGNNRAAYGHFRNAETYNPKIKYTNQISQISTESARLTRSSDLKEQLTNTKKDLPILIDIAENYIEENKLNDAIYYIDKAKVIQPDEDKINIIYGKIAYKKGDFRGSQKIINKILNESPNNLEAIILKSMIINELEDPDSAISFLDGFKTKNELIDKEILAIQKAEYIKQETGIDSAIKYLLDQKELLGSAKFLIYLAKLFKNNGDATNALQYAEKALGNDSGNIDALFLLGEVARDIGDLDKAIDFLLRVIAVDPFDGKKYIVLSQLFENRRDYKRAIGILMEGLDILPKDYDLMRYTGILLYKQGRYKEADLILEKAIEMDNEDPEIKNIKRILDNSLLIKTRKNNKTEV